MTTAHKLCFAEDVLIALGHRDWNNERHQKWVLRWMARQHYEVEQVSIGDVADECEADFTRYLERQDNK